MPQVVSYPKKVSSMIPSSGIIAKINLYVKINFIIMPPIRRAERPIENPTMK
jgi:hypothetical protein